jgi:hypothetical protein
VLIPAFTFAAVPSAVVHANCQPVLVEVAENYRIDIDDFAAKLDDDISAVIISHMRGHTSDMDAIMALCEARGIPGHRGRGPFARHALARPQDRHDRAPSAASRSSPTSW